MEGESGAGAKVRPGVPLGSSLERSLRAGLVDLARVKALLARKGQFCTVSGEKERDWFQPVWVERARKEPFERFPKLLRSESELKGCRRGYDASWTLSAIDLSHSFMLREDRNPTRVYRKLKVRLHSGEAGSAPAASLCQSSESAAAP